jgi:transcriptional regulator with GAF, ATPase, and Fis domain
MLADDFRHQPAELLQLVNVARVRQHAIGQCARLVAAGLVLVGEQPWGLLRLDALGKERLSAVELGDLRAFASLAAAAAAAAVSVVQRMDGLALRLKDERQRAYSYRALAAGKAAPPTLMGQSPRTSGCGRKSSLLATARSRCCCSVKPGLARSW